MNAGRPLDGIRIVDAVTGPLAVITRYLADLGARVDRIAAWGEAARDVVANAGKVMHGSALAADEQARLIEQAHVVISLVDGEIDLAALRAAHPALVTMAVSDFGSGNALSGWQATGPVLHALSAELSRSGIRGREPLPPPGDLAYQCAAPQAAFALLSALYRALRTGEGAHFDFSALDGAVQALDSAAKRLGARGEIDRALGAWLAQRGPDEAASLLQDAGVPAAPMLRIADLPPRATRPAPLAGEQTREVVADWLGLSDRELSDLCEQGILEPLAETKRKQAEDFMAGTG